MSSDPGTWEIEGDGAMAECFIELYLFQRSQHSKYLLGWRTTVLDIVNREIIQADNVEPGIGLYCSIFYI